MGHRDGVHQAGAAGSVRAGGSDDFAAGSSASHVDYYVGLPDLRHRLRRHRTKRQCRSQRVVPSQILRTTLLLPKSIPTKALILEDPEPSLLGSGVGVPGGIAGGREGGVPGGLLNSLMNEPRVSCRWYGRRK